MCIAYSNGFPKFELRSGFTSALPNFYGKDNEDPQKFLKKYQHKVNGMKPKEGTIEQVKLKVFPFALKDQTQNWLFYLPQDSITTLTQMLEAFLDEYMSARKTSSYRKQITLAKIKDDENLNELWDRFQRLISSCPQHGYTERDLKSFIRIFL
ncbi:hypothetical protein Scep_001614 [Stephania cephalantha]|uniref:Retrotransposon gag domain-containing protein n=1 Tax=Stephania cephalantha TaxID=152367 RepID=A0AAP0L8D8_9MAGN